MVKRFKEEAMTRPKMDRNRSKNDNGIGDRMKNNYENRYRIFLTRRIPTIIRLDGKSFHTLTKSYKRPFDDIFMGFMSSTAITLCREIQGVKCAYTQSDEISLLLTDFDTLTTDAWFDYNIQKMTSVSAAIASVRFSMLSGKTAVFDSRTFNIPKEEVCNYFIWRQKDWIRNSIQMYAQAHYSQKQLHGKKQADMHEMLFTKGLNWSDLPEHQKNGQFIAKTNDWDIKPAPIFTLNRNIIECYLLQEVNHDPPT
jgi:tRNA(His) 5'-end guanylyltransferase